ncbi:unnamed protein product [Porites lobata]|uniref:Fibrinogen C-terminal domain-containing protein n=1 Tax=Porites lobata TaxID=104759 RepID=A0ABN8NSL6_9CNID|nr:unnamed protein product [Porites lobata]
MFKYLEILGTIFLAFTALVQNFVNNPSILWDSKNPIFQTNYSTAVLPMSKIKIVCPNPAMIPAPVMGNIPREEMYENLWMVNKQAYDNCTINSSHQNRLLMKCDTPLHLRYFTIVFQRFSAVGPSGLEFEPGKEYYFIATSSGREFSLGQTSSGRCSTHNMRLIIYVCRDTNDSKCITSPVVSTVPPTKTVTVCPTSTQAAFVSPSVTKPTYCSATADKLQVNELLNNTRLIPEIFNQTSHMTAIWAQLKNMSLQLNAVQEKLENCSFGVGNSHVTEAPPTTPTPVFADCTEIYSAGFTASGVYVIKPPGVTTKDSFPVFCDQTTPPGGWIVLQKRFDGSERFSNRTWAEYQNGFGNLTGEFWLGLDKIHLLTRNPMKLRIDLGAPNGSNIFALYQGFTISGADQKYKLTSGRFTAGNGGDSFTIENGNLFSTVDQDNDKWPPGSCAQRYKSGWWHGKCHQSSLNGLYLNGSDKDRNHFAAGITWYTWLKSYDYFFTKSEMKIKLSS